MQRRRILTALLSAPATLVLLGAPRGGLAAGARRRQISGRGPRRQIGDWFQFVDDSSGLVSMLQLTAVQRGPWSPGIEQFSLIFRGALECPIEGALFRVNGAHDELSLFVVPAGADSGEALVRADWARVL